MSDDTAAEERKRRAQARKDKISSRGADRLAKITGAAKGEGEDGQRFGTGGASSSRPTTPNTTTAVSPEPTYPALAAPTSDPLDDPPEVDLATLQSQASSMRGGFDGFPALGSNNGMGGMGQDGAGSMPDMLSALLGGGGGAGNGGGGAFNDQLASMFGGANGIPGQPSPISLQPPQQRPKSWLDRLLPLLHLISMVSLAFYTVFVIEPRVRQGYSALSAFTSSSSVFSSSSDSTGLSAWWDSLGQIDWNGWAALGRGRQALGDSTSLAKGVESSWQSAGLGVASVQLLYIFFTIELVLQTTELVLFKTQPPIPSLLSNFLPYLPPNLSMYAHTGIKYWSMLGQCIDDLSVLVFSIAAWVLFAEWQVLGSEGKIKLE